MRQRRRRDCKKAREELRRGWEEVREIPGLQGEDAIKTFVGEGNLCLVVIPQAQPSVSFLFVIVQRLPVQVCGGGDKADLLLSVKRFNV